MREFFHVSVSDSYKPLLVCTFFEEKSPGIVIITGSVLSLLSVCRDFKVLIDKHRNLLAVLLFTLVTNHAKSLGRQLVFY